MNRCNPILCPAGEELAAASNSREAPISNSQLSEAVTEQLLRAQQTQMQAPEEQVGTWLTKTPCHGTGRQERALHDSAWLSSQSWPQETCPQAILGSLH